ncbi:MAG TPA: Dam family site-specific DNA-(adenine-N6)-methyltransferase [Vicinamibacterales bacterium]
MHAPTPVRPLLKWAGGKRQLLPHLRTCYPAQFSRYIEPFVGSGAVFFDLLNTGRLAGRRARLVDISPDLVGCYVAVRDNVEDVIRALRVLAREHGRRGSECYYAVRDRFNIMRAAGGLRGQYTPDMAAMLIYLNRTGFNGLFRQNRDGEFNVPAGRYVNPRICDVTHLRAISSAWRCRDVTIERGSFDGALAEAGPGDFVYCDPPYAPLSRTANFAHYTAGGFSPFDHVRLQQAVIAAARRGATVVVSNSSAPEIETGYSTTEAANAGLVVRRVPARRAINSHAGRRGPVDELIITNATGASLERIRPSMPTAQPSSKRRQTAESKSHSQLGS